MSDFTLKIDLGNDAMQTPEDVADALRDVVDRLDRGFTHAIVMDENGNTVGAWTLNHE